MSGVRLHSKHGLNPTVAVCFWCGKDKGEIALLGASYKGEAPHRMVLSYEPCDACKSAMSTGITFIGVVAAAESEYPAITPNDAYPQLSPTGTWLVLKKEALQRVVSDPSVRASIEKAGKAFVEPAVIEMLSQEYAAAAEETQG